MASEPDSRTTARNSRIPWPHAPVHRLGERGVFIVTAGTFNKQHFFSDGPNLRMLHHALLKLAHDYEWRLEAWAVFPNHYHFIAVSPSDAQTLAALLSELHSRTAIALNRTDGTAGRKVWHNYRETRLTHQRSYFARLNYVHQNPVKHGLVRLANQYPYGSAAWFERTATHAQIQTIYGMKIDRVQVYDDF
jgi:putative transposase